MVKAAGPPTSPTVALQFILLFIFSSTGLSEVRFLHFLGSAMHGAARKSPELSLALELGSEIMLGLCWRGSPLPPCLPLMHMQVLVAHPQC